MLNCGVKAHGYLLIQIRCRRHFRQASRTKRRECLVLCLQVAVAVNGSNLVDAWAELIANEIIVIGQPPRPLR